MGPADKVSSVGIPVPAEILWSEIHRPPVTALLPELRSVLCTQTVSCNSGSGGEVHERPSHLNYLCDWEALL